VSQSKQRQIPEGYKQTEVGVIPEDWEVKQLYDFIAALEAGVSVNSVDDSVNPTHGKGILKTSCIFGGYFLPREAKAIVPRDIKRAKLNPRKNSIIVSRMNTPTLVGEVGYVDDNYLNLFLPDRLWQTKYKDEISIDGKWLSYILSFPSVANKIKETATGTSNSMKNISKGSFLSVTIPRPCKNEQTAIGNALSDVDGLIGSLEKLIAKKRAIKTAAMQQLLTGKKRLPPFDKTHTGYKKTELGEIPNDWEVVELGNIAKFYKGKGLPKSDLFSGGNKECIHYGELFTTYSEVITNVISKTNSKPDAFVSEDNDVLMPTSDVTPNGLATASGIKKSGVILGGDVLVIRSERKTLDSSFFAYLISISKEKIMQLVSGSTVYHLYGRDMATFTFAKPSSVGEQRVISSVLFDMEKEIEALEQRLNKTKQIKQGMMQELLTGRTRLV